MPTSTTASDPPHSGHASSVSQSPLGTCASCISPRTGGPVTSATVPVRDASRLAIARPGYSGRPRRARRLEVGKEVGDQPRVDARGAKELGLHAPAHADALVGAGEAR